MKFAATLRHRYIVCAAVGLLAGSLLAGSQALWMTTKATLAQHLLQVAWAAGRNQGRALPPWPWADVRPVARLAISGVERSLFVLGDASGEAMAFGPGLAAGDPRNMYNQTIALGGHRDTHLAFLEELDIGSEFALENLDGDRLRYRLVETRVVDSRNQQLEVSTEQPGLVLITCYPFDAHIPGGPLRFVAMAAVVGDQANRQETRGSHHNSRSSQG